MSALDKIAGKIYPPRMHGGIINNRDKGVASCEQSNERCMQDGWYLYSDGTFMPIPKTMAS